MSHIIIYINKKHWQACNAHDKSECDFQKVSTCEYLPCAAGDRHQILNQMLAVCGFAAAALPQEHDGLVLSRGQKVSVGGLGHCVYMRGRVFSPATFKHVHHL